MTWINEHPMSLGLLALFASCAFLIACYHTLRYLYLKKFEAHVVIRPVTTASIDQWNELEQSIRGKLPQRMRDAYVTGEMEKRVLPVTFEQDSMQSVITAFIAADAKANHGIVKWHRLPHNAFVFAKDDFDNFYFIQADDNAIHYWDHDGGDVSTLFDSFDTFWEILYPAPCESGP